MTFNLASCTLVIFNPAIFNSAMWSPLPVLFIPGPLSPPSPVAIDPMEVRFALPQGPVGTVRSTSLTGTFRAGTLLLCCASFLSAPCWVSPLLAQTRGSQARLSQTWLSQAPAGGGEGQANGSQSNAATPPTVNPAPPAVRRPNLELGRRGGAVAELQAVLKLLGFYRGEVNGLYNEATSLAVGRFQVAAKLPQTGRVSANTWNALFPIDASNIAAAPSRPAAPAVSAPATTVPAKPASPASASPAPASPTKPAAASPASAQPANPKPESPKPAKPNPYPTLKLGEEGDAVVRLQRQLKKKGFLEGQPDGAFGPMTEEAVELAQEALGLEVDGVVGPATWRALLK